MGYLTVLVGDQEVGKSYLALAVARTYLTGEPWPDGQPFTDRTGAILWAEAEAGQGMNQERAGEMIVAGLARQRTGNGKQLSRPTSPRPAASSPRCFAGPSTRSATWRMVTPPNWAMRGSGRWCTMIGRG